LELHRSSLPGLIGRHCTGPRRPRAVPASRRSVSSPPMPILRFFFGHGWWILWHVSFYLILLISVVMILEIFGQELKRAGEPPDAPSPGSFMVFMIGVGLAFVTLVDASIFAAKLQTAWYW